MRSRSFGKLQSFDKSTKRAGLIRTILDISDVKDMLINFVKIITNFRKNKSKLSDEYNTNAFLCQEENKCVNIYVNRAI